MSKKPNNEESELEFLKRIKISLYDTLKDYQKNDPDFVNDYISDCEKVRGFITKRIDELELKKDINIPIEKEQYNMVKEQPYLDIFCNVSELVMYLIGDYISFTNHNLENTKIRNKQRKANSQKKIQDIYNKPLKISNMNPNKPFWNLFQMINYYLDNQDQLVTNEELLLIREMLGKISRAYTSLLESITLDKIIEKFQELKKVMDLEPGEVKPITSFIKK